MIKDYLSLNEKVDFVMTKIIDRDGEGSEQKLWMKNG